MIQNTDAVTGANTQPDKNVVDDQINIHKMNPLKQANPNKLLGRIVRIAVVIITPIAILAGAASYVVFLNSNAPEVKADAPTEKPATVDILTANFGDTRPKITVYGQTIAGKQLNLRANVGGEVKQVSPNFKSGALVSKGELLFTIDPFAYEGALLNAQNRHAETLSNVDELKIRTRSEEINLETLKSQLNLAKKDYESGIKLRKRGTITVKALDDKQLVLTQRQQSVDLTQNNLQAQLSQMQRLKSSLQTLQWSIDKAKRDLENTKVYASFDSYVQNANVQLGQLTGTNEQVATLIDRNKMDIVFTLSDGVYGRILAQDGTLIGRKIKLIWQAGNVKQVFDATIDRVAAQITASSGGVELFAKIENLRDIATLRVGSFMSVEIPDVEYKNVLIVPEHILFDNNILYVLENKEVKPKEVSLETLPIDQNTEQDKTTDKDAPAEVKFEYRLNPVQVKTVGYDGKFTLVTNIEAGAQITNGDILLSTKLSSAGKDVLVITHEQAQTLRDARLKKIQAEQKEKQEKIADDATANQKVGG